MSDPSALRLVAITDDLRDGISGLVARANAAIRGGATMIQLRLKHVEPRVLVEVARALIAAVPVPVIVNDRTDVALAVGAAGVHLGADDVPVRAMRAIAPPGFVIGASVGCDEEVANADLADYVGIGPLYQTATKHDAGAAIGVAEFDRLAALCGKPAVAIGGITVENVRSIAQSSAAGIAVVSAVFGAHDPEWEARRLLAEFGRGRA